MIEIKLPGSKSIAARALILDRVYGLGLTFVNMPDCDDTRELRAALRALDSGCRRFDLGTGGTSLRFFMAYVASLPGFECTVDCSDALRRRPLAPLVDALRSAGAEIECLGAEGYAPLRIKGARLDGRNVHVNTSISSQFASALMLVADMWQTPVLIHDAAKVVSRPYLEMTRRMVADFRALKTSGVRNYAIEPDWSAASYFYEYRLLNPTVEFQICGLVPPSISLQGDARCAELFAHPGGEMDMRSTPDLVPALAVGLCVAGIGYSMSGVANLRYKESNRLAAISEEMAKAGYILEVTEDSLSWRGTRCEPEAAPEFDAHGDHRIAMALWAAGFRNIRGRESVSKSFPSFFEEISKLPLF